MLFSNKKKVNDIRVQIVIAINGHLEYGLFKGGVSWKSLISQFLPCVETVYDAELTCRKTVNAQQQW